MAEAANHFRLDCVKCGQSIECPMDLYDTTVDCPNCGEKLLARPNKKVSKQAIPAAPPANFRGNALNGLKENRKKISRSGAVVCAVFGFGLIGNGCMVTTETSIHQVFAAIQYCTGFMLIGMAILLETIIQMANRE